MLEAKILNLAITDKGFAIIMKPIKSNKVIPIFIAPLEAQSIMTGFLGFNQPRPLTHDLINSIFDSCNIRLIHILIDGVQSDTFYAKLVIEYNGKTILIDTRPSDAIALSLRAKTPIFIEENIIETAGLILEESENIMNVKETVPFTYKVFEKDSAKTSNTNEDSLSEEEKSVAVEEIDKKNKIEKIKNLLDEAVKEERYEDAAKYRDELEKLKD